MGPFVTDTDGDFCLTQNQGLFLPVFSSISTSEGVIDALEEVAGCHCDFFIVNSHNAAYLINAHHVNNSHGLFRGSEKYIL